MFYKFCILTDDLNWVRPGFYSVIRQFPALIDPFNHQTHYVISAGQYQLLRQQFPESVGHRTRWPRAQPGHQRVQIDITTGQIHPV